MSASGPTDPRGAHEPSAPHPDWYRPRRLYAHGYPAQLTSALQLFPAVHARLRAIVESLGAETILEIGPGNRPIAEGEAVTYLDLSHALVARLQGRRVEGNLLSCPFVDDAFDLVVAADVLTHVPQTKHRQALVELARVAPLLLIFHPEPSGLAQAAPLSATMLRNACKQAGLQTDLWPVSLPSPWGLVRFGIILARRPSS